MDSIDQLQAGVGTHQTSSQRRALPRPRVLAGCVIVVLALLISFFAASDWSHPLDDAVASEAWEHVNRGATAEEWRTWVRMVSAATRSVRWRGPTAYLEGRRYFGLGWADGPYWMDNWTPGGSDHAVRLPSSPFVLIETSSGECLISRMEAAQSRSPSELAWVVVGFGNSWTVVSARTSRVWSIVTNGE